MKLEQDILKLFDLFHQNNKELYIIGGAVRDYLLGIQTYDYDFTTDALPDEICEILKDYHLDTYQKKIGSIKVHLENNVYEITTMRKDIGVINERYPEKVEFITNLEEDVLRRDFTINSIAYSTNKGIVDYLNGSNDIALKQIRFIKDVETSVKEDAIRIIRALRFSLSLGFSIDNNTYNVLSKYASNVSLLGIIRYNELFRLLSIEGSYQFIESHFNIYKLAYPEIDSVLFKRLLNSKISSVLFRIAVCFLGELDYQLTKEEKIIYDGLVNIDLSKHDLFSVKLLMIKYQAALNDILTILYTLGADVTQIYENIDIIVNEHHALTIKDLKIDYNDLKELGILQKDYSKIFKYLLNEVLKDNNKNNKNTLIDIVKKYS